LKSSEQWTERYRNDSNATKIMFILIIGLRIISSLFGNV
jgi:hypothetical protein